MRVDLHMHTGYSADAQYPQSIDDKIHACEQAGLDIIGLSLIHISEPTRPY